MGSCNLRHSSIGYAARFVLRYSVAAFYERRQTITVTSCATATGGLWSVYLEVGLKYRKSSESLDKIIVVPSARDFLYTSNVLKKE